MGYSLRYPPLLSRIGRGFGSLPLPLGLACGVSEVVGSFKTEECSTRLKGLMETYLCSAAIALRLGRIIGLISGNRSKQMCSSGVPPSCVDTLNSAISWIKPRGEISDIGGRATIRYYHLHVRVPALFNVQPVLFTSTVRQGHKGCHAFFHPRRRIKETSMSPRKPYLQRPSKRPRHVLRQSSPSPRPLLLSFPLFEPRRRGPSRLTGKLPPAPPAPLQIQRDNPAPKPHIL